MSQTTTKLTRCAREIDQFDFELKPVKGKYNVVDALSRCTDFFSATVTYLDAGTEVQQQIQAVYADNPVYSELIKRVQAALHEVPDYRVTDGLLFEKTDKFDRLCIPNNETVKSLILGNATTLRAISVAGRLMLISSGPTPGST